MTNQLTKSWGLRDIRHLWNKVLQSWPRKRNSTSSASSIKHLEVREVPTTGPVTHVAIVSGHAAEINDQPAVADHTSRHEFRVAGTIWRRSNCFGHWIHEADVVSGAGKNAELCSNCFGHWINEADRRSDERPLDHSEVM